MEERWGGGFRNWYAWDYWQASVINRRVISIRATKGCHAKRPCPTAGETRVSRARVLTPAIISGRGGLQGGLGSGQQLSRVTVGSEGGQGQEFLGVRECLLSTHEPGNEGEESFLEAVHQRPQGRCCSLKRTPR